MTLRTSPLIPNARTSGGDFYHIYGFQELLKIRKVRDICEAHTDNFIFSKEHFAERGI